MLLLNLLLVIQIIVCVAMVAVILLQRSEGGALGMGGGGGTGGFMTARGAGNLLTKTTWVLGTIFIAVSLGLTILGNMQRNAGSLLDEVTPGRVDPSVLAPAAPPPAADAAQPGSAEAPATTSLDSLAAPLPGDTTAPAQSAPAQPAPASKK